MLKKLVSSCTVESNEVMSSMEIVVDTCTGKVAFNYLNEDEMCSRDDISGTAYLWGTIDGDASELSCKDGGVVGRCYVKNDNGSYTAIFYFKEEKRFKVFENISEEELIDLSIKYNGSLLLDKNNNKYDASWGMLTYCEGEIMATRYRDMGDYRFANVSNEIFAVAYWISEWDGDAVLKSYDMTYYKGNKNVFRFSCATADVYITRDLLGAPEDYEIGDGFDVSKTYVIRYSNGNKGIIPIGTVSAGLGSGHRVVLESSRRYPVKFNAVYECMIDLDYIEFGPAYKVDVKDLKCLAQSGRKIILNLCNCDMKLSEYSELKAIAMVEPNIEIELPEK